MSRPVRQMSVPKKQSKEKLQTVTKIINISSFSVRFQNKFKLLQLLLLNRPAVSAQSFHGGFGRLEAAPAPEEEKKEKRRRGK